MSTAFEMGFIYLTARDLIGILLGSAFAFGAGLLYGRHLVKKNLTLESAFQQGPRAWGILLGFLGICLAIGMVYKIPDAFHPRWLEILEPLSWLAAQTSACFLAGMAFPLARVQNKTGEAFAMLGLAVLAITGVQAVKTPFVRPIYTELKQPRIASDGSILQNHNATCTAAALANALQHHGKSVSEKEVAQVLGTRRTGTSQYQLLNGVEHYQLYPHYVPVKAEYMAKIKVPTVVSVHLPGGILHSIMIYDHDQKGNLMVVDPMSGKGKYSPERYTKDQASQYGVAITAQPLPELSNTTPSDTVTEIQKQLMARGLLTAPSGRWGKDSRAALSAFQQQQQLPVTGELDALTWLVLNS